MLDIKEKHVPEMFYNNVREMGDQTLFGWKEEGVWKTMSWREAGLRVRNLALGLISLGVGKKDHVAIFSPNRPEWGISDIAILSCAGADIPIYPTNSAMEAEYILNDSGSSVVIAAEREHLDRILQVRENVPGLNLIITMDKIDGVDDSTVLHFDEVMALGERYEDKEELNRRLDAIDREDMATLIYTSGTTGPPKGVILTHKNFLANIYQSFLSHEEMFERRQCSLSFLPLSHSLERTTDWYVVVYLGGTIYFAESLLTVVDNMKEIHPHFVIGVPRLFEKIHAGIHEKLAAAPPRRRKIFAWAAGVGAEATAYLTQNRPMPLGLALKHRLAKAAVFNKVRANLGAERIRIFVSGGGPLAREINEFFNSLGLTVHEGYGLTETAPVATATDFKDFRFGTVGKPVKDTEIKIAEDGEILIKGPQVMKGYYNKPEATKEVFTEDGWFKTGDIGELEDGFLKITDRKKELIITAGGKNISPQNIENAVVADRYIENVVAIGDRRRFISALIVPDFEALEQWAEENNLFCGDRAELVWKPEVQRLYEGRIREYNELFSRAEQIKKFRLIDHSFSQEGGELTPTMKLKRKVINDKYGDMIEDMYR